jgi:hypothetical protein
VLELRGGGEVVLAEQFDDDCIRPRLDETNLPVGHSPSLPGCGEPGKAGKARRRRLRDARVKLGREGDGPSPRLPLRSVPTFLLAIRNAELDAHNAQVLARIVRETATEAPKVRAGAIGAGDRDKLRGLPVCARGIGGAVKVSVPHLDGIR